VFLDRSLLKQGKRNMNGRRSIGRHAQIIPTLASARVHVDRGMNVPEPSRLKTNTGGVGEDLGKGNLGATYMWNQLCSAWKWQRHSCGRRLLHTRCTLFSYKRQTAATVTCVGMAYKIPIAKIAPTPTLSMTGRCSFLTSGSGSNSTATSVMILMIA
jgi:hypothetical protein